MSQVLPDGLYRIRSQNDRARFASVRKSGDGGFVAELSSKDYSQQFNVMFNKGTNTYNITESQGGKAAAVDVITQGEPLLAKANPQAWTLTSVGVNTYSIGRASNGLNFVWDYDLERSEKIHINEYSGNGTQIWAFLSVV